MDFDRNTLLTQLKSLKPALSSGSLSLPELKQIWFQDTHAFAYDGSLGVRVECKTGLNFGVPGQAMLGLLEDKNHEKVSLDVKSNALEVRLGKACAKLPTINLESSPWGFPLSPSQGAFEFKLTEALLKALRRVQLSRSSSQIRVEQYGVVLFPDHDLILYACSAHSVSEIVVKADVPKEVERTVLPYALVDAVLESCGAGDTLYISDKCLMALGGKILIGHNVLDVSNVEDLPALVDKFVTGKEVFATVPDGLLAALDRVGVLAGGGDAFLTLNSMGKRLELFGRYTYGEMRETLSLDSDIGSVKLEVDAKLLRTGLGEALKFSLKSKALIMKGDGGFLYLLVSRAS